MSNHNSPIPPWLNEEYMGIMFKNYYKNPDILVKNLTVSPGSKVGDNYACQIIRIKILLETNGEQESKSVIGKLTPRTATLEAFEDQIDVFAVEGAFFHSLLPKLTESNANITAAKTFAPECYLVDLEKKAIFMEDMMEKNYYLQPRLDLLSKEQALLVLTKLASLHGASYRVVQNQPEFKDKFKNYYLSETSNKWFDNMHNNYEVSIERHCHKYGLTEERIQFLKDAGKKMRRDNFKICTFDESKLNVLCHGDCWKNNMLFHSTNGQVDDVILLDYQGVTYNSFVSDIHHLLFTSVSSDILAANLDLFLEHYYKTLQTIAPEIPNLSLDRVRKEFFERLEMGLFLFSLFRPIMIQDDPLDMDEIMSGVIVDQGYSNPRFIADLQVLFPIFEKIKLF